MLAAVVPSARTAARSRVSQIDEHLRRHLPDVGPWQPTGLRQAAVLCPLVRREHGDHLLFVVRPVSQREHAGQIAFPGGMRETGEHVLVTARRECREEIGVPDDAIDVLGGLPPRTSSSGIMVHAVVARLQPVALRPDPREVARVLHVPLAALLDEARWAERPPPGAANGVQPPTSPHFLFDGELLWGLTARFVRDLLAALRR